MEGGNSPSTGPRSFFTTTVGHLEQKQNISYLLTELLGEATGPDDAERHQQLKLGWRQAKLTLGWLEPSGRQAWLTQSVWELGGLEIPSLLCNIHLTSLIQV